MKKRILAGIMAALMVAVTAGCGTTSGGAESAGDGLSGDSGGAFTPKLDAEESATVNIIGSLENFEALEAVISDFGEYYPNCDVVYSYVTNYKSVISERLASDDTVGIFLTNNLIYSNENVASFCVDLNQEDIDFSGIQQAALNSYTADDILYALPLAQDMSGLVVNEDILEDEGIEMPTNYEEFMAACEKLKNDGYMPIQGYQASVFPGLMKSMEYVALEKAGDVRTVIEGFAAGDAEQIEILRPSLERLSEIVAAGYVSPEVNATYEDSYNATILKFFEGDVPFLSTTTETFSGMKKRETKSEYYSENPFKYSFISTPIGDEDSYSYIENWQGFSVNKNCPDKEWAIEFMRFLATEDEINQMASVKHLPSVAIESDDTSFKNIYPDNEEYLQYSDYNISEKVATAIWNANLALGNGETDVDGALAQIQAELTAE